MTTTNNTKKQAKPVKPVVKPFLRGTPTDERTGKGALAYLGILVIASIMSFLVCSMLALDNVYLRVILNLMVVTLVMIILYNNAANSGTDAVARGEILYQKQERGISFAESERRICFHPLKGYLTALLGSIPLLICAVLLAAVAHKQSTGFGSLPGWMSSYAGRSEVGNALVAYTQTTPMGMEDILRIIVRILIMPFVSMVGAENRDGMLLLERLSPLILLLPAAAYGTGYLQGTRERMKIHTGIAQSNRKRANRERKARKARMTQKPKTPEQLN